MSKKKKSFNIPTADYELVLLPTKVLDSSRKDGITRVLYRKQLTFGQSTSED